MVRLAAALLVLLWLMPARADELRIEVEASPASPYLQQEVVYVIRLWRASSLQHGYLMLPEIPDAIVEPLADSEGMVERDGRRWRVEERRLAVFPQRSGRLVIPPPVFSGRDSFQRGEPVTVDVRPKPERAGDGWWSPARSLRASETWPSGTVDAGQPVERTITVEAEGLSGSQLPPLSLPEVEGVAVRRLDVRTETSTVEGRLVGRRIERHIVLPQRPGAVLLPALRLDWWDVGDDTPRTTELPPRVLDVAAPIAPPARTTPAPATPVPAVRVLPPVPWAAVAAALVFVAALTALAGYGQSETARLRRQRRRARRRLKQALRTGDATAARAALLDEAGLPSLAAVSRRLADAAASQALRQLDAAVFSPAGGEWDRAAFARTVLPALERAYRARPPRRPALPDLVP